MSATPPDQPFGAPNAPAGLPACYRHHDRATGLSCSRCGKPACPECLREASVGYQCLDCVAQGNRTVRRPTTIVGARPNATPVVVYGLIALNVIIYAITAVQSRSLTPSSGTSHLYDLWVEWPPAVAGGGWWSLLTAGFLHVSPIHIGMNMISLWIIGRDIERILGRVRFTAVYLVALLGGSVSVLLFGDPEGAVAGASGAVFGLMGGVLVIVLRLKLNPGQVIGVIALNLALSVAIPGISLLGHLGGLVIGALITAAFVYAPSRQRAAWQIGAVVVALAVLASLVLVRDAQLGDVFCVYSPHVACTPVATS